MELHYILNEEGNGLIVYGRTMKGDVHVPPSAVFNQKEYPVTEVRQEAFNSSRITSISIPDSVTKIGERAFAHCGSLKEVVIGNSSIDSDLKSNLSIGWNAFQECTQLQSVSISDLESWCNISFENGMSNPLYYAKRFLLNGMEVNRLVIPKSVNSINDHAFQGCSSLTEIVFGDSLRSIGRCAFKNCRSLKEVILPDTTADIGAESFMGCIELSNVVLGRSISRIGDHAFYNCRKLKGITHSETTKTTIGKYALDFTPVITHKYVCYHRFQEYRPGSVVEEMVGTPESIPYLPSRHWVELDENNIVYFDIKGDEPLQRLKERLNRNMVPVEGFDYPFSICRCKFSQEDYAVVMGVDHFYNAEEPLGADCPYVTEEWNVWSAYHSSQNWGEIRELLELLEYKTGRHFRLPTIKECEFINTHKEELGFQLKDELCMASSYYLCTESGNYHVSSAMEGLDYPAFYSFRLVECETPLSSIHFTDKQIVDRIEKDLSDDSDDMHYYWEN